MVSRGFREQAHPGTRASRPHALPLRSAQFPCDGAPGHPAGGNGVDRTYLKDCTETDNLLCVSIK